MYVQYSPEVKTQAIELHNTGKPIATISKELGISESTLHRWFSLYTTPQSVTEEDAIREITRLTAECKHMQNVIEIIRQSGYIKEIPLQRRLDFAEHLYKQKQGFRSQELYEALEITKGTFYYRLNHSAGITAKEKEKYALMLKIHEIFEDSNQIFGVEKIHALLARQGIRVSNKRVSALMREMGLESVRIDAKKQYQLREKYSRNNLVHRNFKTTKPNEIWVSDITAFKIKGKWQYLCVIIDLYSRKVVGFHISKKSSTQLLSSTFKKAFSNLLKENGITQSLSMPGQPLDNAVAESFFSAFKKEEAYRKDYVSERHFIESVTKYIDFYNNARPHKTNRYKTPTEFEENVIFSLQGSV